MVWPGPPRCAATAAIWSRVLAAALASRFWRSDPPKRPAKDERGDGLVDGGVAELGGEGVEAPRSRGMPLLMRTTRRATCRFDRRRGAGYGRLDGGEQAPVGGHAVAERLDPGGQGLEAADDAARGRRLEGGAQRPADGPADGRAHRPVGDQPDDGGEDHRTERRLGGWRGRALRHATGVRPGGPWTRCRRRSAPGPTPMPAPKRTTTGVIVRTPGGGPRSRSRSTGPAVPAACRGGGRPVHRRRARRRSRWR